MECQLQNLFETACEIEYSVIEKAWMLYKTIPIFGTLGIFLLRQSRRLKKTISQLGKRISGRTNPPQRHSSIRVAKNQSCLNLNPGDGVRVRSRSEIEATLDENGKFQRVDFMDGMWQYCGKEFKVFKRVEKIYDPHVGRYRKCRDMVILEGLFCHGSVLYPECDRTCLYYWKEAWLEKIE